MSRRALLAVLALGAGLVLPSAAEPGAAEPGAAEPGAAQLGAAEGARVAVGLAPGADPVRVAAAVERRTGERAQRLTPIPALVVDLPAGVSLKGIRGVRYVEPTFTRRLALTPSDPLVSRQWYLAKSRFYETWPTLPSLLRVPVAVLDSGVDENHPELAKRIFDSKTFVGGSPLQDTFGHGTFVSGLIAAGVDNDIGIAGLAPSAELLVAKVVTQEREIPIEAEAKAIRWAVKHGAKVINMSFGGIRDPLDPNRDTFSQLEADAVAYAASKGVLVVAAVGNTDETATKPWEFASYPAALPHVLGVSALTEAGTVPKYSNRDRIYNDLAAPGHQILSIFPRSLTARFPACAEQGYSSCGPDEYREAQGTSFAAPLVSAAAAQLLSIRPGLRPDQTISILQDTAVDLTPETGCLLCREGRDEHSGWGRLDVAAALEALEGPLPVRDRFESNDDAGRRAVKLSPSSMRLSATIDYWDDQDDVYALRLREGQRIWVSLAADRDADLSLALWRRRTRSVTQVAGFKNRLRLSAHKGLREHVSFRAPATGWYYVQVRISSPGHTAYRLSYVKRTPGRAQRT